MTQKAKTTVRIATLLLSAVLAFSALESVESAPPLGTPQLLTPANGSVTGPTPTFSWTSARRATSYQIQVTPGADVAFASPLIDQVVFSTSFVPVSPLQDGEYRWRVRARRNGTIGSWSSVFTFTVQSPTQVFADDFSSYTPGTCMADGTVFGPWTLVFNGFGCTMIEASGTSQWLHESPQASTMPGETHSALVTGPSFTGALTYEVTGTTVQQLRAGSSPNPWEVGWVIWHYTDSAHFYYFIAKPNGWELGKRDPVYPGGQRFLATGSSPTFPVGALYRYRVSQDSANAVSVSVNGTHLTTFTDTERPYASGSIALYTEDAHVHWDDVTVSQP